MIIRFTYKHSTTLQIFLLIGIVLVLGSACRNNPFQETEDPPLFKPAPGGEVPVLDFNATSTDSADWNFGSRDPIQTFQFDKRKYPDAISIVLRAELYTSLQDALSHVRLYNLTHQTPIQSSEIEGVYALKRSRNLLDSFPDEEIELAIQVKSGKQGILTGILEHNLLLIKSE